VKVSTTKGFTLDVTLGTAGQLDVNVLMLVGRRRHQTLRLVGVVVEHGSQGSNRFVIKLVSHHKLKRGSYELTVYTVSGTTTSPKHTIKLTVTG
jgi:hypothetical protein